MSSIGESLFAHLENRSSIGALVSGDPNLFPLYFQLSAFRYYVGGRFTSRMNFHEGFQTRARRTSRSFVFGRPSITRRCGLWLPHC